jgi:hypothetical protein
VGLVWLLLGYIWMHSLLLLLLLGMISCMSARITNGVGKGTEE